MVSIVRNLDVQVVPVSTPPDRVSDGIGDGDIVGFAAQGRRGEEQGLAPDQIPVGHFPVALVMWVEG